MNVGLRFFIPHVPAFVRIQMVCLCNGLLTLNVTGYLVTNAGGTAPAGFPNHVHFLPLGQIDV